jgi:hypothetical protein
MTVPDGQPSFGPPTAGDEVATLLGSLERQRATFAWKVADLDSNGLAAEVGASAITLGGLIKHLAFVEDFKLTTMLLGQNLVPPWDAVDWEHDAAGRGTPPPRTAPRRSTISGTTPSSAPAHRSPAR